MKIDAKGNTNLGQHKMNTREKCLLYLGEHAYVGMNSAIIVMDVFSYLSYVGQSKKEEKLRRKEKEYGIIEVEDVLQLIKVSLMCFNHENFNYLLFY